MAEPPSAAELQAGIDHLAEQLAALATVREIALLGIANGGIVLAQMLAQRLGEGVEHGVVNALFHRDDLGLTPVPSNFQPSSFEFRIDDAHIVLVDDVFASGRTARATLNELFDHGRPATVHLAVLVDTQRPRLPLRPDFVGLNLSCGENQTLHIQLDPNPARAHTASLESL